MFGLCKFLVFIFSHKQWQLRWFATYLSHAKLWNMHDILKYTLTLIIKYMLFIITKNHVFVNAITLLLKVTFFRDSRKSKKIIIHKNCMMTFYIKTTSMVHIQILLKWNPKQYLYWRNCLTYVNNSVFILCHKQWPKVTEQMICKQIWDKVTPTFKLRQNATRSRQTEL